jgi:hypothetical protein
MEIFFGASSAAAAFFLGMPTVGHKPAGKGTKNHSGLAQKETKGKKGLSGTDSVFPSVKNHPL